MDDATHYNQLIVPLYQDTEDAEIVANTLWNAGEERLAMEVWDAIAPILYT